MKTNMLSMLFVLSSIGICLVRCSSDDATEDNSDIPPSWSATPEITVEEGVAGSYNFPELERGSPACECSLVLDALPTWLSLSQNCILSWTDAIKKPSNDVWLVIQASNRFDTVDSDSFKLTFKEEDNTATNPTVIFEENFDDQPDWSQTERCIFDNASEACNTIIEGWDYLYTDDKNPAHAPFYVEAAAGRGGSGKGYHLWDESRGDNQRWKAEGQLAKRLPQAYEELWFSFWIRFNPEAEWEGGAEASKVFRAGAYNPKVMDGTARRSVFNTNGTSEDNGGVGRTTGGMFFVDVIRHDNARTRVKLFSRCNPTYKCGSYDDAWDYFVNPDAPSTPSDWNDNFGDGGWHKLEIHYKQNTSPGVGDGVLEVYYDETLLGGRDNIPWRMDNSEEWIEGINLFAIAGNSENVWAGDIDTENAPEQSFYFIDDVKVCTERCP